MIILYPVSSISYLSCSSEFKNFIDTRGMFGMVVHVQTNTINVWILPCKCFMVQKYFALCTDIPY